MKKKTVLSLLSIFCLLTVCFGQAKKPTLMVVPSDNWCANNGYTLGFNNQGTMEILPDYEDALMSDPNMLFAISKIGELMADQGFPLKDLGMMMKSLRNDAILDDVTESSEGDGLAENPRERLMRVAKADIVIQLTYNVNRAGPKSSLTYNMQGIDAYTFKQIAAASGTGTQMMGVEFPVLLEKSIVENMNAFLNQLDTYFTDLFTAGREVKLVCRTWANSDVNFESEYDGEELGFLIEDWMATNTVQGRFSTSDASENRLIFEQVRIPLATESGRAVDTRYWANDLRKWLKSKYSIESKLSIKGLGEAIITLGAK